MVKGKSKNLKWAKEAPEGESIVAVQPSSQPQANSEAAGISRIPFHTAITSETLRQAEDDNHNT